MIVMLTDVWDLQAIDALDDELAFRIQAANVSESRLRSVDSVVVESVERSDQERNAEAGIPPMSALRQTGFLSDAETLTPQSRSTSRLALGFGLNRFSNVDCIE